MGVRGQITPRPIYSRVMSQQHALIGEPQNRTARGLPLRVFEPPVTQAVTGPLPQSLKESGEIKSKMQQ